MNIEKFENDLRTGLAKIAGRATSYHDTEIALPLGAPLITGLHFWAERELAEARTPAERAFLSQYIDGARKTEETENARFLADLEELKRLVGEHQRRKPAPANSARSYARDRRPVVSQMRSCAFDSASFPLCAEYLPDSSEPAAAAIARLETVAREKSKPAIKGFFAGLRIHAADIGRDSRVRDLNPASVEGILAGLSRFGALRPLASVLAASENTPFYLRPDPPPVGKSYSCER